SPAPTRSPAASGAGSSIATPTSPSPSAYRNRAADRTRTKPPSELFHLPVLVPGGFRADALAGDGDVEEERAVGAGDLLQAATEGRLELLHRGDGFTVDPLRAREADVVGHGLAQEEPRVLAVADHLAVRHVLRPVRPHHLVVLVVRHHDEDRGVVARHRPEAGGAVPECPVTQVEDHGPLAPDGDLGPDAAPRPKPSEPPPLRVYAMPPWPKES